MTRALAVLLIAVTYAAEVIVWAWHLVPGRRSVFA